MVVHKEQNEVNGGRNESQFLLDTVLYCFEFLNHMNILLIKINVLI